MTPKIVVFGASNSKNSINKKFASFAAAQIENVAINLLDLNDFEMPIYSIDRERETGIPALAHQFKAHIKAADSIIISFAEHNGAYSVAFKNVMDWMSRIKSEQGIWENKPMFLLSTSPGGRGGKTVLGIATNALGRMTKNKVNSFSLPSFNQNFSEEKGITDEALAAAFQEELEDFKKTLLVEG
jgi:NAD(P)H-dependent FMN reductase